MTVDRRTIRFEHELLRHLEHPAFEARGRRDGPHLALIGGIHGCEYSSIAAVTKVMREHKKGELKSGSGKKVKTRKQTIAIAMSESGQSKM